MNGEELRALALALPGSHEAPHHDRTSFRAGRIFVTMPADEASANVLVDEHDARAAVAQEPGTTELVWWGRRLSGVRVRLAAAGDPGGTPDALVGELLQQAWRRAARRPRSQPG